MMHRSASSAGVPQLRTGRSKLRIRRWASGLTLLGIALTSVAWLSPESGCFGSVDGSRFSRRLQIRSGDLAYQWQAPGQPLLTIVTATLPFSASGDNRVRAIESWLQLSPQPTIVLLGNDTSFRELAAAHPQVRAEPYFDVTFEGKPLFSSMIARAQAADTPFTAVVNGDILLLDDLMETISRVVAQSKQDWVLTAERWDVDNLPTSAGSQRLATGQGPTCQEIREHVKHRGQLHTYGGVDLWVWNTGKPLLQRPMPPFIFGRSRYDNWLTHELAQEGARRVVDATTAMMPVHVRHNYAHLANASSGAPSTAVPEQNVWTAGAQECAANRTCSYELFINAHLSDTIGSYRTGLGTARHWPTALVACEEPRLCNMCFMQRQRPGNCSCEHAAFVSSSQSDSKASSSGALSCGGVPKDTRKAFETIPTQLGSGASPGLPHTLDQLLPKVAENGTVRLVAVTGEYTDMLMNFLCTARRLGIQQQFLVAALDEEAYKFAFLQGLAVYLAKATSRFGSDCLYGSPCFKQVTKLKSQQVLQLLQRGYDVLFSDVDVVWFSDPLPAIQASYAEDALLVQSNEPNMAKPDNGLLRVNSGFYFVRAVPSAVRAFSAIVLDAANSNRTEQPSFYHVLCGNAGQWRVGSTKCREPGGLITSFLSRQEYPNGGLVWDSHSVPAQCKRQGCVALHNNWAVGLQSKQARLGTHSLWHYDAPTRLCKYNWANPY